MRNKLKRHRSMLPTGATTNGVVLRSCRKSPCVALQMSDKFHGSPLQSDKEIVQVGLAMAAEMNAMAARCDAPAGIDLGGSCVQAKLFKKV
jgi:hypothetical protein